MKTRNLILAALFAALTAVGSLIKIPTPISSFSPLFFFTAVSAVLLGAKYGALSQLIYVLLGLSGLPVFTTGGGLTYVFTTTFGFLIGLIPAAAVIGLLTDRLGSSFRGICISCTVGLAVLYLVGLPYMHYILTVYLQKDWSIGQTVMGGMVIFLPWDALKIVATALLGRKLLPRIRRFTAAKTPR